MTNYMEEYRRTGDESLLQSYYDESSYAACHVNIKPKWKAKYGLLSRLMDLSTDEKVLDIGCAHKGLKPYVESSGADYKGADIASGFDPDYLANAETLEGVPDIFDWVVLGDVLEHLSNPGAALRAALGVGKHMVVVVPNWYRLECLGGLLPRDPNDRHLQKVPPRVWLTTVRESGWKIDQIRGFYYVPSLAFYPFKTLRFLDKVFLSAPFRALSAPVDRYLADKPLIKYMGQELVIVGSRP